MKLKQMAGVWVMALLSVSEAYASQTVLTFENLNDWDLVDGYGGISGWQAGGSLRDYSIYPSHQPDMGDRYFAVSYGGAELSFDSAPVVFEGVHYNFVGFDSHVSYDLYYQNQLVYSAPLVPENQPPEVYWLASGYAGLIDKIYFHGTSDGVVVDNLTYSTTAPVPLPGAAWLFASALAGVAVRQPRRQTRWK
ncbi:MULTISPECIES: hypothetical protein [Methylomonas]|uniref:PEP-CTERM protein-sorting domain-containing protein n=1 Tax=Methylomonas koyamae TaxID=702114 RepID=A0A177N7S8_9GAMM|nr:hypothetical protein [Methylomonas koyamae]OAI13925.1 hypothetical protein A1355_12870 [Methylomonas koyamae]